MFAEEEGEIPKPTTQYEDYQLVQESMREKHSSPEVKTLFRILRNHINKVTIVAALPALLQLNSEPGVVAEGLSSALRKIQILSEKLEPLEGLKEEAEVEGARGLLEEKIKNSVRDLLRIADPDTIFGLIVERGLEIEKSESVLISDLKEYYSLVVEQCTVGKKVSSQTVHDAEQMILVENSIKKMAQEFAEKAVAQELQMKHFHECLRRELNVERELKQRKCRPLMVQQTSTNPENDQRKLQLANLRLENNQSARELCGNIEKVDAEIEYLLQSFDEKMEEMQATLEFNTTECKKEDEELKTLEEHLSVVEAQYNEILEKRRLREEKRVNKLKELEATTKATIIIQAWWRGYSTRKALKARERDASKGKKGKKTPKSKGKKTK